MAQIISQVEVVVQYCYVDVYFDCGALNQSGAGIYSISVT